MRVIARIRRDQDGQMFPLLLFLLLATLAGGWALFEVGKASALRSDAQTAADAAALAGTGNVLAQIKAQVAATGTVNMLAIADPPVRAAAEAYAARNGATVTSYERFGVDVRVTVGTRAAVGEGDEAIDVAERHATARARASLSYAGLPVSAGIGGLGGALVSGAQAIPGRAWDAVAEAIGRPPFASADLVALGRMLEEHGIDVAEHPAFGGVAPVHAHGGANDHYHGGAIDVNVYPPGAGDANEAAVFDRIAPQIVALGFHVLWRYPGHAPGDNSHMHVDIGATGLGSVSGSPLLGDATAEVRLVPWEGGPNPFTALGAGGGNPFGPPDLEIACAIFTYVEGHGLSDRLRLAAFEAAIVESGVHNLSDGDRDSLGVFQQRPSQGWGTPQQIQDVGYAIRAFFAAARAADRGQPAEQLAQDTQRSAFPERYGQHREDALALIARMEESCSGGSLSS